MMITNAPEWPNGAKCAVAFTFDLDADSILHLSHHASADTRIAQTSALRYGPEVALPRLLSIYREFGMRQTFFLPAWCMERYKRKLSDLECLIVLEGLEGIVPSNFICVWMP